jgi:hypothetical protein
MLIHVSRGAEFTVIMVAIGLVVTAAAPFLNRLIFVPGGDQQRKRVLGHATRWSLALIWGLIVILVLAFWLAG